MDSKRNKGREALRQLRTNHPNVREGGKLQTTTKLKHFDPFRCLKYANNTATNALVIVAHKYLLYRVSVLDVLWKYLYQGGHSNMCQEIRRR